MTPGNARVVLTPEHVPIVLEPAGLGSRFVAFALDQTLILALVWTLASLLGRFLPQTITAAVFLTAQFFLAVAYPVFFEVRRNGQTPGKRFAGIRVVDGRGLPISVPQSFVRNIARLLDSFPPLPLMGLGLYGVGGLACMLDRHYRRLGDLAADTLVIKESRAGRQAPGQVLSPRRFNSLRVPRVRRLIRHKIGLEEREFLLALCLRAEQLEAQARFDLFEEVGAYYRGKLNVDDPHLSGENLVRDLTAILYGDRES
jgi:uncharacterized RDD family membrane protein YckC